MSKHGKVLLQLISLSLLVYIPIINKGLASDDFGVIHRVVFEKILYIDGFFRPLSDISLYFCYLIGGFDGWIYNLFNILLHAASAFLLYINSLRIFNQNSNGSIIALSAAVLFVLYPFHNEAIVWVVGRASNLSCFLGFYALYLVLTGNDSWLRNGLAALLFFGSLSTYETSITLPFIAALLVWHQYPEDNRWLKILVLFGGVVIINLLVRTLLVKEIVGDYGARMFDPSITNNLIKFLKTAGRLFLPPMASSQWIVLLACLVFALIGLIFVRVWKKEWKVKKPFLVISLSLLFSCAIPFLFGVSTRTIEGDRLLYFPSYFLCIWIAYVMITLLSKKLFYWGLIVLGLYFLTFLEINNYTWRKADQISKTIIADVSKLRVNNKRMVIYRLPEEYKGAHIFRNGFLEALDINGIDTTGIRIGSFQGPSEFAGIDKVFHLGKNEKSKLLSVDSVVLPAVEDTGFSVIYWNNQNLVIFR